MSNRRPYEVTEYPELRPLDYVGFHAIIEKIEVPVKAKHIGTSIRPVRVIRELSGHGQVVRVSKGLTDAVPPRFMEQLDKKREVKVLGFRTARVDT